MKTNGKRSVIKYVLVILLLAALLFSGVYAWIIGDVVPKITGTMSIGNEAGVILKLAGTATSLIDMNKVYGITTGGMSLTEVSSADGETFFKRDTSVYYEDENKNEIITYCEASPIQKDNTGRYIDVEVTMTLTYESTTSDYYIYFLNGKLGQDEYTTGFSRTVGSPMTDEGLRAMRMALQIEGLGSELVNLKDQDHPNGLFRATSGVNTYIALFGKQAEDGTTGHEFATNAVISTGQLLLTAPGSTVENAKLEDVCGEYKDTDGQTKPFGSWTAKGDEEGEHVVVHSFEDYSIAGTKDGGTLSGNTIPNDNYLFVLNDNSRIVTMDIRIWLEGGSADCVDGKVVPNATDTSDAVKLDLYFVAFTKTK